MGSPQSKVEEKKTVDSSGVVNNSLVVAEEISTGRIEILLIILCILKLFEFAYFVYSSHTRRMKKKYTNNTNGKA